ncbi:DNA translocase FtsK, partial [uncultured Methylobacterium sp.]|uniref:DNA translocase FtsK n=1 Tax=uncultured Methylobacterium sp. TaxID=157278 RepID=UPI0035CAAA02
MRASGRPPYSHRDPSRPGRGVDRPGLSLGALAHRLLNLRASLARRIAGPAQRPGYPAAAARPAQTWLVPPGTMLGREQPGAGRPAPIEAWPVQAWQVQVWPDHVFDDRATLDMVQAGPRSAESRIDEDASGPRVLIRSPRRPTALMTEDGAPGRSPAPEPVQAVRYTRTPDPVLQERRQRARDAERAAQAQAEALEAVRALAEANEAAEAAAQAERAAALPPEPPLPLWRQPFVMPPGVRFFRSPDRKPVTVAVATHLPEPPAEAVAADWSEVPDWSDMRSWFDGQDFDGQDAALEAWTAIQAEASAVPAVIELAAAAPASDFVLVEVEPVASQVVTASLPASVYGFDRLVRFDPAAVPCPADGQDNAAGAVAPLHPPRLSAMAARAAIRSARPPSQIPVEAPVQAPSPAAGPILELADIPVPEIPAAQVIAFAVPFSASLPVEAEPPSEATGFVPTVIAPRPVLLRNPKSVAVEEVAAETPAEPEIDRPVPKPVPEPEPVPALPVVQALRSVLPDPRATLIPAGRHVPMSVVENADYELPSLELLAEPDPTGTEEVDADVLEQNALNLQQTVQDFGVRGDILAVRPGPVVT